MFYTSASWLDENNLHKKDLLILRSLGLKTFGLLSIQHRNFLRMMLKLFVIMERQEHVFSSQAELLPGKHLFDHNIGLPEAIYKQIIKQTSDPTQGNFSGRFSVINNAFCTMTGRF